MIVGTGLRRLLARLLARQGSFVRGLAVLTSASILQTLITFAAAPIVARLFSPAEFGIAGLIQALGVVPVLMASGQYHLAIGIARSRSESINLAFMSISLAPICAALLLPLSLYLQARSELLPTMLQGVAGYLWTIPALMIAATCLSVTRLWEIRLAHYRPLVTNRLIESGVIAGAQIGLGLAGVGALGLIMGRWLGVAAAALHGLKLLVAQLGRQGLRRVRPRRMCMLARRHWRFPFCQLPAQAIAELSRQLSPLLLGLFYSLASVGFYWFANRLLERPAIIYGSNLGRVFYQHAADNKKAGRPVSGLYWRSTGALVATSLVPFGAVILFGPALFEWVFGTQWERAGHFARWIALANLAFLIGFPARVATALFALQRSYAIVESLRAVTNALAIVLVARAGGGELVAVGIAAAAQSAIALGFVAFVGMRLLQLDRRMASATGGAQPGT